MILALMGAGIMFALLLLSVLLGFLGRTDSNIRQSGYFGHGLPPFVTVEMMVAFFEVQEDTGIPVSTGIAQLIAEAGYGNYGERGDIRQGLSRLAYDYHNLFGVKFFDGTPYVRGAVDLTTWEYIDGEDITIVDAFAIYDSARDAILHRAHMLFLPPYVDNITPYLNLEIGTYTIEQANRFANGIWVSGWATDPDYVEKLIHHMEHYNLYRFNNMTWDEFRELLRYEDGYENE